MSYLTTSPCTLWEYVPQIIQQLIRVCVHTVEKGNFQNETAASSPLCHRRGCLRLPVSYNSEITNVEDTNKDSSSHVILHILDKYHIAYPQEFLHRGECLPTQRPPTPTPPSVLKRERKKEAKKRSRMRVFVFFQFFIYCIRQKIIPTPIERE